MHILDTFCCDCYRNTLVPNFKLCFIKEFRVGLHFSLVTDMQYRHRERN